jgi:hypothetical protein
MAWSELLLRGVVGGAIISVFALLGDVLKPKSFAGLFGAAPSVALASLALTYRFKDALYVAKEAEWMVAGALGFALYAWIVCRTLRNGQHPVKSVAIVALVLWFVVALGIWRIVTSAYQS